MFTFKTWKKFGKPGKIFEKMSGNLGGYVFHH